MYAVLHPSSSYQSSIYISRNHIYGGLHIYDIYVYMMNLIYNIYAHIYSPAYKSFIYVSWNHIYERLKYMTYMHIYKVSIPVFWNHIYEGLHICDIYTNTKKLHTSHGIYAHKCSPSYT